MEEVERLCIKYAKESKAVNGEKEIESIAGNIRGVYNVENWDDNDMSTWTWQIDHIKPMAKHSYSCETDLGFQKAWSLKKSSTFTF